MFREAVANALIHRDYTIEWGETSVRLLEDRIEVASPGLLVGGLTADDLARGAVVHPPRRNPALVDLFFHQTRGLAAGERYVERAGSGIRRMEERLAALGLPPPEFREDEPRRLFVVTLRGAPLSPRAAGTSTAAAAPALNPRQRVLLERLQPGQSITARVYQERFGVSRALVTRDLRDLVARGLLETTGAGPARQYRRIRG